MTGTDAAAKQDVLTTVTTRFPPARIVVAETPVQGPRAAAGIVEALLRVSGLPEVDVIVLTRGGGSFEDLLPFSDEAVVRAVASCPVPVVSAVGHEQDVPLCDLAADVRASTPTAAGRLVVPDLAEVLQRLERARAGVERGARRTLETQEQRLVRDARPAAARPGARGRAQARPARGGRGAPARALAARDARPRLRDRARPRRDPALGDSRLGGRAGRGRARRRRLRGGGRVTEEALTFEAAQKELEAIVEQARAGRGGARAADGLSQRGEELYRFCREKLDAAHGKIEELAKPEG